MRVNGLKWGVLLLVVSLFVVLSCTKEKMAANKLEGYWDVTKCVVDGDNALESGLVMTFLFLEYSDGEGEAVWTWEMPDGPRGMGMIFTGEYALNKDGDEVEMDLDFEPGTSIHLEGDLNLEKGEFEIEGEMVMPESSTVVDVEVKAEKHE